MNTIATKAINRWLETALAGWEYHRKLVAHQWSIDDGAEHWTVDSQSCESWVRITYHSPDIDPKSIVARNADPAVLPTLLAAMRAPEVVES